MVAKTAPRASLRASLLRAAAQYSAGTALGLLATVLRVGAAARLLPRDAMGMWLGLQLILSYGQNLHLGLLFGMFRNVPLQRAAGDSAGAEAIKRASLGFLLLMSGAAGLVLALTVALLGDPNRKRYIVATGVLTIVTLLKSYYVTLYKGDSRFRELSVSSALGSIVSVATLALIWRFGLDGLIWGMTAQAATEMAYLVWQGGLIIPSFDGTIIRAQLTVGAVTLVLNLASVLLTSMDRTVMLRELGAEQTGYYYLGANILVLLPTLVSLPAAVLTPQFFERVGRGEDILPLIERPMRMASVSLAALLGAGALALPAAVAILWPKLALGNSAAIVALLSTYPLVLAGLVGNVFYALNRQAVHLAAMMASCATSFLAATVAVRAYPHIGAATAGSALGLFVYFLLVVVAAYRVTNAGMARAGRLVGGALLPLVLVVGLVIGIHFLGAALWPASTVVRAVVGEATFCLVVAPAVFRAARDLRGH